MQAQEQVQAPQLLLLTLRERERTKTKRYCNSVVGFFETTNVVHSMFACNLWMGCPDPNNHNHAPSQLGQARQTPQCRLEQQATSAQVWDEQRRQGGGKGMEASEASQKCLLSDLKPPIRATSGTKKWTWPRSDQAAALQLFTQDILTRGNRILRHVSVHPEL